MCARAVLLSVAGRAAVAVCVGPWDGVVGRVSSAKAVPSGPMNDGIHTYNEATHTSRSTGGRGDEFEHRERERVRMWTTHWIHYSDATERSKGR